MLRDRAYSSCRRTNRLLAASPHVLRRSQEKCGGLSQRPYENENTYIVVCVLEPWCAGGTHRVDTYYPVHCQTGNHYTYMYIYFCLGDISFSKDAFQNVPTQLLESARCPVLVVASSSGYQRSHATVAQTIWGDHKRLLG